MEFIRRLSGVQPNRQEMISMDRVRRLSKAAQVQITHSGRLLSTARCRIAGITASLLHEQAAMPPCDVVHRQQHTITDRAVL